MKRKETVSFINKTIELACHSDACLSVVDTETGDTTQFDSDFAMLLFCHVLLGINDLMEDDNSEFDNITPPEFIAKVLKATCQAYVLNLEQR